MAAKRSQRAMLNGQYRVFKKLEPTEQRLMKQPERTLSYDMKVKEKLTVKEKNEWKGPVHYVAHHAALCPEKKCTPIRIVL